MVAVTLSYYIYLISKLSSNKVYSLIPLSKILDLEKDDLSLHNVYRLILT